MANTFYDPDRLRDEAGVGVNLQNAMAGWLRVAKENHAIAPTDQPTDQILEIAISSQCSIRF
jgi:hypothetical protein